MISYHEALKCILNQGFSQTKYVEEVALDRAVGRVLAEHLYAREDLPSYRSAAMDGFALRSSEGQTSCSDRPTRFVVCDSVGAGDFDAVRRSPMWKLDGAIEIMTGAPLYDSQYDAVVRVEDVVIERRETGESKSILTFAPLRPGENVRLAASDCRLGKLLISEGRLLRHEELLPLAATGVASVVVRSKPRVALISTGQELEDWRSSEIRSGQVRNVTQPYAAQLLVSWGCDVVFVRCVGDDPIRFSKALEEAGFLDVDLVLTTGAVSMGIYDFVPAVLRDAGAEILFHKVAIRPAKPVLFGSIPRRDGGTTSILGAPGNPSSSVVAMRFFLYPWLRAVLGLKPEATVQGRLSHDIKKPDGLTCFYRSRWCANSSGEIEVDASIDQSSYKVSPFINSNAWAILNNEGSHIERGSLVELRGLSGPLLEELA